jgi:hypothetical protein
MRHWDLNRNSKLWRRGPTCNVEASLNNEPTDMGLCITERFSDKQPLKENSNFLKYASTL